MSIWLIIWFVLCAVLVYFFGWTNVILYKQKKAWRSYAEKLGLRYTATSFMAAPDISGAIDDYTVHLFSGEHPIPDGRSTRKMTALEVDMNSKLPMKGVVASGGMVAHVKNHLEYSHEVVPKVEGWKPAYIVRSENKSAMEKYLTRERVKVLLSLMNIKNAWLILIFQEDTMLLRVDTPYPFDHPAKIDKMIKKVLAAAKTLELKPGEGSELLTAKSKSESGGALEVNDDTLAEPSFELEEDPESD